MVVVVAAAAVRMEEEAEVGRRAAHCSHTCGCCTRETPVTLRRLVVDNLRFRAGLRRAPEAMVSLQAAQAALWGA